MAEARRRALRADPAPRPARAVHDLRAGGRDGAGRRARAGLRPRRRGRGRDPAARSASRRRAAGATPSSPSRPGRPGGPTCSTGRRRRRAGRAAGRVPRRALVTERERGRSTCGRRSRSGSGCRWATPSSRWSAASDGWWTPAEPLPHGREEPTTATCSTTRTRRDPTRGRGVSRRARTSSREPTTRVASSGPTRRLGGPRARRVGGLRAARRHVHAGGHASTPRSTGSTTCVDLGRRTSSS